MHLDNLLNAVEQMLPPNRLGTIERFILQQSWLGQTYSQMAQESGYGSEYIKEIGSRLWQDLSDVVGKRVTKKNLQLVFNHYSDRSPNLPDFAISTAQTTIQRPDLAMPVGFPGAPIAIDSPFYIERPPVEKLACAEIQQPGSVIRIKAPRQTGKSSLLNRIVSHAQAMGYRTVELDFREADQAIYGSLDRFLRWFCTNVSHRLQLEPDLESYWDEEMGSKVSCKIYFSAYLLEQIDSPIVLVLNEINQLFEHPKITQDFLPMLRFWHEQAKQEQTWQKLRLMLVHTTDVYVPLNLNQSPFNVGLAIKLPPFTLEQVQELAQRYGLDWSDNTSNDQATLLQTLVGGHPYLVSLALYHLRYSELTMEQLLQSATAPTGIYSSHLRQLLALLGANPDLRIALQQIITADGLTQLEPAAIHKLESLGLIQLEGTLAQLSCELYRSYFREQLHNLEGQGHIGQPIASYLTPHNEWGRSEGVAPSVGTHPITKESAYGNNTRRSLQWVNAQDLQRLFLDLWHWAINADTLLSIIRCEVDFFQYFVEAYGAETGENCLKEIGQIIQDCVGSQQALASYHGGAEFTIICPETNPSVVAQAAECIRSNVEALGIMHDQSRVSGFPAQVITVSLGVSTLFPELHAEPTLLLTAAEQALHQSKRGGRNRVSVHSNH